MCFFLLHPPSIFDTTDNIWPRRLLLKKPITLRHFNKSTHTRTDETATNPHLLFPPLESSNPISHQGHFSHSLSSPLRTHQCVFSGAIRVYYCNPQNQVTQNREENQNGTQKLRSHQSNLTLHSAWSWWISSWIVVLRHGCTVFLNAVSALRLPGTSLFAVFLGFLICWFCFRWGLVFRLAGIDLCLWTVMWNFECECWFENCGVW